MRRGYRRPLSGLTSKALWQGNFESAIGDLPAGMSAAFDRSPRRCTEHFECCKSYLDLRVRARLPLEDSTVLERTLCRIFPT
jgi:hypothetical protein